MEKSKALKFILVILFMLGLTSCTSELREYQGDPSKGGGLLNISGEFCADKPSDIALPVKIVYLIDQSGSMASSDPQFCRPDLPAFRAPPCDNAGDETNMRQEAMRAVWNEYVLNPAYYFAIIPFNSTYYPITTQPNGNSFVQGLVALPYIESIQQPATGAMTDMYHALEQAKFVISFDLSQMDQEDRKQQRYVVILLTDGVPDDGDGAAYPIGNGVPVEDHDSIVEMAEAIVNLKSYWGAGDITINTGLIINTNSDPNALDRVNNSRTLLTAIQLVGSGIHTEFNLDTDPTDIVTFSSYDLLSYVRTFTIKSFVAYNLSAKIDSTGSMVADTDTDGLSDQDDQRLTGYENSFLRDSDSGGCVDFAEILMGLNPDNAVDDTSLTDTDGDSCPDILETSRGSNPAVAGDCNIMTIIHPNDTTDNDADNDFCPAELEALIGTSDADPNDCSLINCRNNTSTDTDGDTCPDVLENAVLRDILDPTDCHITMFSDMDSDGCSDYVEISKGLNPLDSTDCTPSMLKDSDNDGCGDFVETSVGSDALNPFDCDCRPEKRIDSDLDGLLDCEEELLGYATTLFDSDKDGLTDLFEFHGGSNAISLEEGYIDSDMDGFNNNTEVREHTNPKYTDGGERGRIAYKYTLTNKGQSLENIFCYDFKIENITLFRTQADIKGREGVNHVVLSIIETPQDVNFSSDQGFMRSKTFKIRYYADGTKALIGDDDETETVIGANMTFTDEDIKAFEILE